MLSEACTILSAPRLPPPRVPIIEVLAELQSLIARHTCGPRAATAIAGLSLARAEAVSALRVQAIYEPMVCVVAQGSKQATIGTETLEYDEAHYLISSVHLPVSGRVVRASAECPYLALSLRLDPVILAAILLELPPEQQRVSTEPGFVVGLRSPELFAGFVRLLRLLDRPEEIGPLAPLLVREIHYRLLTGEHASTLRQIAMQESRASQISRSIDWIRQNFHRPLAIDALARRAGMSPASLHRHFKAVTSMSPLQYQKQLRLQEARHRLVSRQEDAATAGFAVGYGSPSQFSREYHRLFGAPPRQDAERLRSATLPAVSA